MFANRIPLFRVAGIQISADLSWFIVLALVTWQLAHVFPTAEGGAPGLSTAVYWAMGFVAALLLFASIVLHELGHALVAQRLGVPIRGITLFIFGGVAEMADEPPTARAEFLVAIAGPIVSVVLGVAFLGLAGFAGTVGWPAAVVAVATTVGSINLLLVVFNMIPAFPLDGGRVLRSALWQWKGNLRWATRVSSRIGTGLGLGLIALGVMVAIGTGNLLSGMWLALIGFFVRGAARMSYQQLLLRRALEGETVARFMHTDPVVVPRSIPVADLVRDYVYRHHFKTFPVVEGDRLVGCVSTRDVRALDREEWDRQTVGTIAEPCSQENTVAPELDAMEALSLMSRTGRSRLLVAEGDHLLGILSLKDLLKFFSLKMELEEAA
ncbi:MAG TPA: site-2 protease family protein [Acidimicrobiia bacterium]|nr:site-2 protease family protein [Acidimicrobiia bacterium]